jgi:uncharacterized protein (TIGR02266 family)
MHLDRKRSDGGLLPSELRRWIELKRALDQQLSSGSGYAGAERRTSVRVPARTQVSFGSSDELGASLMTNLSRGGLFVVTDKPAEMGTRLELCIHLEDSEEDLVVSTLVASVGPRPDADVLQYGMGLRFDELKPEVEKRISELYERKLREAAFRSAAESSPDDESSPPDG